VLDAAESASMFDAVWVDKGVYLWPQTVARLRAKAGRMIYYTPDTSFFANRSRHFNRSMHLYDLVVTTKSFEIDQFRSYLPNSRIHLTTQAFDPGLHAPAVSEKGADPLRQDAITIQVDSPPVGQTPFRTAGETESARRGDVAFIGLCDPDRERAIATLLSASIRVRVGGHGWKRFRANYDDHPCFTFIGERVFSDEYVNTYRTASVGLGLLSKRFPELHTTRTFEIPACRTVLATEKNVDTTRFFDSGDVLFFDSYEELADRVRSLLANADAVEEMAERGYERVIGGGFSYDDVVGRIFQVVGALGDR
jgi:glycosyltransferase involved in cell wall biosynthesis